MKSILLFVKYLQIVNKDVLFVFTCVFVCGWVCDMQNARSIACGTCVTGTVEWAFQCVWNGRSGVCEKDGFGNAAEKWSKSISTFAFTENFIEFC